MRANTVSTSWIGALLLGSVGLSVACGETAEPVAVANRGAPLDAKRGLPEPATPGERPRAPIARPEAASLEKPAPEDMGDGFARPPSSPSTLAADEPPIEVRSAALELTLGLLGGAGLRANIEYVVAAKEGAGPLPPAARLITRVACPTAGETRADVLMKPLLGVEVGGGGGQVAPRSAVAFFDEGLPAKPHRCDLEFYYQPGVLADEALPLPEVFSHEGGGRATAGTTAGVWSKDQPVEVRATTAGVARATGEGGGERYLDLRVTLLRGEANFEGRSVAVTARCDLPDGSRITGEGGVFGELWALEPGDVVVKRAPVFFEDPPLSASPRVCTLRWRLETPLQPEVRAPLGVYCLRDFSESERSKAEAGVCEPTPSSP